MSDCLYVLAQTVENGRRTRYVNSSLTPACTLDINKALCFADREAAEEYLEAQTEPLFTQSYPSWHAQIFQ